MVKSEYGASTKGDRVCRGRKLLSQLQAAQEAPCPERPQRRVVGTLKASEEGFADICYLTADGAPQVHPSIGHYPCKQTELLIIPPPLMPK